MRPHQYLHLIDRRFQIRHRWFLSSESLRPSPTPRPFCHVQCAKRVGLACQSDRVDRVGDFASQIRWATSPSSSARFVKELSTLHVRRPDGKPPKCISFFSQYLSASALAFLEGHCNGSLCKPWARVSL
ncbi:unnamed protein product [Durusdinium trenchii]|uniref:Uncharacterized protein n=1 Tax=Durusdinium trenchii TaxID=1381693 RepID=A0ABP0JFW3_9DINO